MNLTIDIIFIIDIFVTFFSAYYEYDDQLIDDRKQIAISYAQGWLLIDLASVFPFELLLI